MNEVLEMMWMFRHLIENKCSSEREMHKFFAGHPAFLMQAGLWVICPPRSKLVVLMFRSSAMTKSLRNKKPRCLADTRYQENRVGPHRFHPLSVPDFVPASIPHHLR
jgi:hypothetical protein